MVSEITQYKLVGFGYFALTFCLVGFAIVAFVQGIAVQLSGNMGFAFLHYLSGPLMIFLSYTTFVKAREKIHIIEISPK